MNDNKTQILIAALELASEDSPTKISMEDVAQRAGVSRATIYRHFEDGKDQLLADAVAWEVSMYFERLKVQLSEIDDLSRVIEEGLRTGRQMLLGHQLFQKVVELDPSRLLSHLSQTAPLVQDGIRRFLIVRLEKADLRTGVDVDLAATFLARSVLSLLMAPARWDLTDPVEVHELVRGNLLAGILKPAT